MTNLSIKKKVLAITLLIIGAIALLLLIGFSLQDDRKEEKVEVKKDATATAPVASNLADDIIAYRKDIENERRLAIETMFAREDVKDLATFSQDLDKAPNERDVINERLARDRYLQSQNITTAQKEKMLETIVQQNNELLKEQMSVTANNTAIEDKQKTKEEFNYKEVSDNERDKNYLSALKSSTSIRFDLNPVRGFTQNDENGQVPESPIYSSQDGRDFNQSVLQKENERIAMLNKTLQQNKTSPSNYYSGMGSYNFGYNDYRQTGLGTSQFDVASGNTLSAYDSLSRNDDFASPYTVDTVDNPLIIRQGTVIPAILLTAINSDLPGQVTAQITRDIYDTPFGTKLLIPKGSKIIGQYGSSPNYGQERVMLGFNRIIFPDGKALVLGSMPAMGTNGMSGVDARVNNHMWRLISSAVLLGGITTSVTIASDRGYDSEGNITAGGALSQSMSQSLGDAMSQVIRRNMSIAPTLEVDSGFPFNVTLTKDIRFNEVYKQYQY